MQRPTTLIIVSIAALLTAGCASFLAYRYLKSQGSTRGQGVAIVAAATDIPVGTRIEPSSLKMTRLPKEALAAGYHTDAARLSGRIAVKPLSAGDMVTEAKLMPATVNAGGGIMTYMVPDGHRAVTVAVNEVAGVAGFITPNSRVDIVLTTPTSANPSSEDNISKIILQNVPVLASGQITEQKEGKPAIVPTVTLDLSPADAEKLIVGAKKGSLQLLLRNIVDTAEVTTRGATVSMALDVPRQQATPRKIRPARNSAPAPPPPAPAPPPALAKISMEVIRGGVKSNREFPAEQQP